MLGSFTPSTWTIDVIEQEFRRLSCLPVCCQRERISVRPPQGVTPHPDNLDWHQDGGGAAGTTQHMVVWASHWPTELKTSDGQLFETPVASIVWFDNTRAWHRQPTGADEEVRWFVAIRCSGAIT